MTPNEYYDLCDAADWGANPEAYWEQGRLVRIANRYGYYDMFSDFLYYKVAGLDKPERPNE